MNRFFVILIVLSFVFAGCDQSESPVAVGDETSVFQMSITAEPELLPLNSVDAFSTITATLVDESGNAVGPGREVSFFTSLGTIESSATTNDLGQASVLFHPGEVIGDADITAKTLGAHGPIEGGGRVCIVDPAKPVYIEVTAEPREISVQGVGGNETSIITATLKNGIGEPVSEEYNVRFELVNEPNPPAGCKLNGNAQVEDMETVDGAAFVGLNSGTMIGSKLIRISTRDQDNNEVESVTAKVAVLGGPPFQLDIDVNDRGIDAGGGAWLIEVSARVWDMHRNPVADGYPVVFTVDPEIANISSGFTGDETRTGMKIPGLACSDLIYNSLNSFDPIEISADISTNRGQISGAREHILPLQRGRLELNMDPGNWMFNEDNENLTVRCWAVISDGHGIKINNAPILFSSTRGQFYWQDFSNDQLIRYFPSEVRKYTGIVDRQNNEEPGQATVFLMGEMDVFFLDPFSLEANVRCEASVEGYDNIGAEPKFLYVTRSAG